MNKIFKTSKMMETKKVIVNQENYNAKLQNMKKKK